MGSPEENKKLVERASFEVWNRGNVDMLDELVTDDYVLHDGTSPEDIQGREAVKEYIESYREAFPDLEATIDEILVEGNMVAVRWTARGTHKGTLPDVPELEPTGTAIEIMGLEIDRIEGDRVAETWQTFDMMGVMEGLGAVSTV